MKKILLSLCVMCCLTTSAQEIKAKKTTNRDYTEYFAVKKKTRQKHGPYLRMNNATPDTLMKGAYENGERAGEWSFYDKHGKLYFKYDYLNKAVTYLADTIKAVDKFFVKTDSALKYTAVDRPPLYLSNEVDIFRTFTSLKLPITIPDKSIKGKSIATFEIDTKGNVANIKIKQSLHREFDKNIVEIISKLNTGWLPAIKDGVPVVAGYVLVINVVPMGEEVPKLQELPFMFVVTINYGNMVIRSRHMTEGGDSYQTGFKNLSGRKQF